MSKQTKTPFVDTTLAGFIGMALLVLSIAIGFGGCSYLIDKGTAARELSASRGAK